MVFIGIDVGTTSIGGAVLDLEKRNIIEIKNVESNAWLQASNSWERIQDPDIVFKKVSEILDYFIKKYKDIMGICITGQMHGIIYLNNKGIPLTPLFTWQDNMVLHLLFLFDVKKIRLKQWKLLSH